MALYKFRIVIIIIVMTTIVSFFVARFYKNL